MPTPWARPLNIYKRCSVVSCHVTCVFYETSKIRNNQAENVFFFRREKQEGPNLWNVVDEWSQKYFEPGRSNSAFFRGHVDPSYLHLIYLFELGNVLRRFSPKHRGWHTQREWWRREIWLRYFDAHIARRLRSRPAVGRRWNQLGYSTDGVGVGSRLSTQPSHGYCPA